MKLVSEATKEELEQALAALNDPYKPFKDALNAGKRVRYKRYPWRTCTKLLSWDGAPEDYEIEPKLYCGHTEEEWQFVIDNKLRVLVYDNDWTGFDAVPSCKLILTSFTSYTNRYEAGHPFLTSTACRGKYCHIVREKNHPQPAFGRSTEQSDMLLVCYEDDSHDILRDSEVEWDLVKWFINLSRDG